MYMGQFVIMSVTTDAIRGTHEEYEAWQEFCDLLDDKGLFYLEAEGCYKGEKERSLVIQLDLSRLSWFLKIAKDFNQESILWVNEQQEAMLLYPVGGPEHDTCIGQWKDVDESIALKQNAWTKVGDCYYICE